MLVSIILLLYDRLVYSVINKLCPSAQARRVLRHGGRHRRLREGQRQVPSIPDSVTGF